MGYNCWVPQVRPLLSLSQCRKRLNWAKEKKNWTVGQWSKVLFSDESLQSGFVTLPRLSRLDRQFQDGDIRKGSLPDSSGITLTRSDSLTSFTVDLGPSLMTEVLSLIDNPSCLHMSNHSQAAGEKEEGEEEEEDDNGSLIETPVQSPVVTSPSSSMGSGSCSRNMNNRGRSCSSDRTEQEEERSLSTPDVSSGSPQRAEPVMEAERFQRAADVLCRHYGGGSFTKRMRIDNTTTSPALSHSCKTPYAFSEEEEEIKV
ncbi:uncharacterized protein LOC119013763 [Acanthopagrus latus]|uniref:uncharacterized protein LOC119013763 n=1 Tax=Acanthopagrus latus TaxID=8177 RepID=UPI00187CC067|nr:uncharacterized protein LOC119013763 [Acanthopagrus latus]